MRIVLTVLASKLTSLVLIREIPFFVQNSLNYTNPIYSFIPQYTFQGQCYY